MDRPGRLLKAPEGFLGRADVATIRAEARHGRRDFLRSAFATAATTAATTAAALSAASATAQTDVQSTDAGDPNILNLPDHGRSLGQGVATDGYGRPSKFEANLQRRTSPGLTQTAQSGVSFCPLQGLFGIVTPSGLHFERHHQGGWDIAPDKHRLMLNGSDPSLLKRPMVFSQIGRAHV